MEFNKFIDFGSIFDHLIKEHGEDLEQHRFEADHFNKILGLIQRAGEFKIMPDECEFADKLIWFLFVTTYDDSNESNRQSSFCSYLIKYDRLLEEFTECEYEQG